MSYADSDKDSLNKYRSQPYDVEQGGGGGSGFTGAQYQQDDGGELRTYVRNVIDCEVDVRMNFIRNVYSLLSMQLLATLTGIVLVVMNESARVWTLTHPVLLFVAIMVQVVSVLLIVCTPLQYQSPWNLVLLATFTASESYLLAVVSATYTTTSVFQAVLITAAIVVGLTLYVMQSTRDFTGMGPYLFAFLLAFTLAAFLRIFLPTSPFLDTVYAFCGAVLFSCFIIYDTALIMDKYDPSMVVPAALALYLDIINLFLYVLELLGDRRR